MNKKDATSYIIGTLIDLLFTEEDTVNELGLSHTTILNLADAFDAHKLYEEAVLLRDKAKEMENPPTKEVSLKDQIEEEVWKAIESDPSQGECIIDYVCYECDDDGEATRNNLHDPVTKESSVILTRKLSNKVLRSPVLTDPTWLDCAIWANKFALLAGDTHHSFFEGITLDYREGETSYYEINMGS